MYFYSLFLHADKVSLSKRKFNTLTGRDAPHKDARRRTGAKRRSKQLPESQTDVKWFHFLKRAYVFLS